MTHVLRAPERHPPLPGPLKRLIPTLNQLTIPPQEMTFLPSPHPMKLFIGIKYQKGKVKYAKNLTLSSEKGKHVVTILVRKHKYFWFLASISITRHGVAIIQD